MIIDDSNIWEQIERWSNGTIEYDRQDRPIEYDHSKTIYEHRERICEGCD